MNKRQSQARRRELRHRVMNVYQQGWPPVEVCRLTGVSYESVQRYIREDLAPTRRRLRREGEG